MVWVKKQKDARCLRSARPALILKTWANGQLQKTLIRDVPSNKYFENVRKIQKKTPTAVSFFQKNCRPRRGSSPKKDVMFSGGFYKYFWNIFV